MVDSLQSEPVEAPVSSTPPAQAVCDISALQAYCAENGITLQQGIDEGLRLQQECNFDAFQILLKPKAGGPPNIILPPKFTGGAAQ